ncbi:hypothetical protein ABIB40_002961 [Pedobacter sp. UYP30]
MKLKIDFFDVLVSVDVSRILGYCAELNLSTLVL